MVELSLMNVVCLEIAAHKAKHRAYEIEPSS